MSKVIRVKFDEVDDSWVEKVAAEVAAAALHTARIAAAARLVEGPVAGRPLTPSEVVELLLRRDEQHPLWDTIAPYEQRWALLVIRAVDNVTNLAMAATADARRRGTSWAAIGRALGGSPASSATPPRPQSRQQHVTKCRRAAPDHRQVARPGKHHCRRAIVMPRRLTDRAAGARRRSGWTRIESRQ